MGGDSCGRDKRAPGAGIAFCERFAYSERSKNAFAIVRTGETALYANVILKKGVIGQISLFENAPPEKRLPFKGRLDFLAFQPGLPALGRTMVSRRERAAVFLLGAL